MVYVIGLIGGLAAFWLGMSGHYTPLLLGLGTVSILVTVLLAGRLGVIDREGSSYHSVLGVLGYLPWLGWEIAKANVVVIRACLRAELDIHPALVKVRTSCESDSAKTLFANSITLTPGTVTVAVERNRLLVHALYEQQAQPEAFAEMDRRSRLAMDGQRSGA